MITAERTSAPSCVNTSASRAANIRFGSKADICSAKRHVRFTRKRTFGGSVEMSAKCHKQTHGCGVVQNKEVRRLSHHT